MPRLFTALEIPADVKAAISSVRGGLPRARWIDPENYHVTLRFIGDVDDTIAQEAAFILRHVRREAFEIKLDTLSSFGGHRPRAIVALVTQTPALMEMQAEHERLLRRIGLEPEGRKYTPHVTVARLRDTSSYQVADYLSARGHFRVPLFEVPRFVLYSSRDSVGGGPYVVEADYPLLDSMPSAMQARR
jgi:2'-5' RNA ligase